MKDNLFNSFKEQFETLKTNTTDVRERAEAVIHNFFDAPTHAGIVSSITANDDCELSIELPIKDELHRYSIIMERAL